MNWNLVWVCFVRMCLITCCMFIFGILLGLTGSGLPLAIALTLPSSLAPVFAVSFLLSGLISFQHREWMSSRLDWPLAFCGAVVVLGMLGAHVYEIHRKIQSENRITLRAPQALNPVPVVKQWTAKSWTGEMPDCLKLKDSMIENNCPGRVSVTYCWRMDPSKDWGLKDVDCELNKKTRKTFAVGSNEIRVPWCRAYHEICQAELKAISAKALDN